MRALPPWGQGRRTVAVRRASIIGDELGFRPDDIVMGEEPSAMANQAIWDHFRQLAEGLQLSGKSRLIEDYEELCRYYERMVAEKLQVTSTLELLGAIHAASLAPRLSARPGNTRLESRQPRDRACAWGARVRHHAPRCAGVGPHEVDTPP
jgi:hypothetical protein